MLQTNFINRRLFILIPLVGLLIFSIFMLSYGAGDSATVFRQVLMSIVTTASIWLGCMAIVVYLWRRYPWEQYPVKHLVIEVVLITTYTLIIGFLLHHLSHQYWRLPHEYNLGMGIAITLLITFLITSIHEGAFFYMQWKHHFSKSVRLERDNMEARYESLRSQINPHFLFNSLNSLTSLVDGNPKAVEYLGNLSELLRYMLKSHEKELVLVRDELSVLNNYIHLQKLRFGENLHIVVDIPEKLCHFALPPLAIQMLVENAVKHNIITKEYPLTIKIFVENETITVENNLQRKEVEHASGQGLNNIRGRYRLFTSKGITVDETGGVFKVTLPLLTFEI